MSGIHGFPLKACGNDTNEFIMNFVDTHCHLHFPDYQTDQLETIKRAQAAGVQYFINVGTDCKSTQASIDIAEKFDFIYATAGIHPHDAKDATPEDMCKLAGLMKHPKIIAIGEVGFDFYRNLPPEDVQRKVLAQFFDLAKQNDLPLVLHIRDAYPETAQMIWEHFGTSVRAVSHCFSSTREVMDDLLKLGLYISFAGPITYKKNDPLREAAKACPLDRILVETDAPFLAPQLNRGKRNEPAYLMETAKQIAELKQISLEALGQAVTQNCEQLFRKPFHS